MSKLQDTRMLDWRLRSANLYNQEFEQKLYGALNLFLSEAGKPGAIVTDEVRQKAVASMGNTIKIPVLKNNADAVVGSERSCTNVNNETDSALVSLTWQTITDGFNMYPTRYMSNDITYQQHFDANMAAMLRRIAIKLDQLCLANLATNKTTVLNDTLNYTFSAGMLSAAFTDRMDIIGDLNAMLLSINQYGNINIVGNMGVLNTFNKLAEHDTYNAVNKRFEYADKTLFLTNQLANGSGQYATMYAVADNQVDILSRVSRAEASHVEANEHTFGETFLPMMGNLKFGTHFYTTVGDVTTETGESDMVCEPTEHYGFAIDVALVNAYASAPATTGTGILAAQIAKA